ncbi:MAG: FTR1 family protein, partial [Gemmatimonadaceae bacterium]
MPPDLIRPRQATPGGITLVVGLSAATLAMVAVIAWVAMTSGGNPDPTAAHTSLTAATLDIGVLVFREGLECILVLAAITASMVGSTKSYRRPITAGAVIGFFATLVTWSIAVSIIDNLTESFPALQVQAVTGLLAIIVLLVVMNWFFHKLYWTGWISLHNKRKRDLLKDAAHAETSRVRLLWGLGMLGFT